MKRKHYTISIILSIALIAIVSNQAFWVSNMYDSYKNEIALEMNGALKKAIGMEHIERAQGNVTDGVQESNAYLPLYDNTTNRTSVRMSHIGETFLGEMKKGKYPVQQAYIQCYNLRDNLLVESTLPRSNFFTYMPSDMMIADVTGLFGVKLYIENPQILIMSRMMSQLILSAILILFVVIVLILLGRTIRMQWKQDELRQKTINSITHEFKRPITTALSMTSLIPYYLEQNEVEKVAQYAEYTVQELNKLTTYAEQIRQIGHNEQSAVQLVHKEIAIKPFFDAVCEKYRSSGKQHAQGTNNTIDIQLDLQTTQSCLYADILHLSNVMDNLIENAIKYANGDLEVKITVSDVKNFIRVSVEDNGMGISQSDKKYIFEEYYRSHAHAAQQMTGFGLGLTYVKSIVEAHKGKIHVDSEIGKGTGFIMLLPVKS